MMKSVTFKPWLFSVLVSSSCLLATAPSNADESAGASDATGVPQHASRVDAFSTQGFDVYREGKILWLMPTEESVKSKKASLPRLCAPIRRLHWQDQPERMLKFVPEPERWDFSWSDQIKPGSVIEVEFDTDPVLPGDRILAKPAGDGSVMLHAYNATTHGEKLRFEPQWFKNTVGYWTIPTDYAVWELQIDQPGDYSVALLQGCGKGQGGSDAVVTLRSSDGVETELEFQTIDTGHFQNFRWNHLGLVSLTKPGTYEFRLAAKQIANKALFDVRAIHLVKQAIAADEGKGR